MEKYVFDCREDLNTTPKYLKRNQNVSHNYRQEAPFQNKYLKDKVFITFDYSYYRQLAPKNVSAHTQNRMNTLSSLIEKKALQSISYHQQQNDNLEFGNRLKWRKQQHKTKDHRSNNLQIIANRKNPRKTKSTLAYHPGVGDYEIGTNIIHKKIVKDIKLDNRQKKQDENQRVSNKLSKNLQKSKQNINSQQQTKVFKTSKTSSNYLKQRRNIKKAQSKQQEQFWKFMNSIDVKNVWKNLTKKHRLKPDFVTQ